MISVDTFSCHLFFGLANFRQMAMLVTREQSIDFLLDFIIIANVCKSLVYGNSFFYYKEELCKYKKNYILKVQMLFPLLSLQRPCFTF